MEKESTIKQKVPAFFQNSPQRFTNYPRILKRTSLKGHRYRNLSKQKLYANLINFRYNVNRAAIVRFHDKRSRFSNYFN